MLLAEISFSPLGNGASVSAHVARVVDLIDRSGLAYRLGPMGTCVEGEWEEVMDLMTRCFRALEGGSERISVTFKGDWRRGPGGRLESKVERVEQLLGRPLRR